MRMTAAVMYEQGLPSPYAESLPYRIEEVDLEGPADGEVLVEVVAAGLCHSDLSQVAGLRKRKLPVVGGHEGAGIVREVGRGVENLREGDRVVMTVASGCGRCRPCVEGRQVLCENMGASRTQGVLPNGARRLSREGEPVYHYSGISSFAQYAVCMPMSLVRIDPSIPLDVAAIFGCAVLTGAGAVFNSAKLRPGQSVAVFGLGGVGLNAVMAARIAGASEIVGVDLNTGKFDIARELGCTRTILANDASLVEQVRDVTGGGVDFAFEVSGSKAAMASAVAVVRKGGEVVCVGMGAAGELYQYVHATLIAEEKVFRGSFMGSSVPERDIATYSKFLLDGRMPIDRLRSDVMGFDGLNLSLDLLDRGEVVRQVLLPNGAEALLD